MTDYPNTHINTFLKRLSNIWACGFSRVSLTNYDSWNLKKFKQLMRKFCDRGKWRIPIG